MTVDRPNRHTKIQLGTYLWCDEKKRKKDGKKQERRYLCFYYYLLLCMVTEQNSVSIYLSSQNKRERENNHRRKRRKLCLSPSLSLPTSFPLLSVTPVNALLPFVLFSLLMMTGMNKILLRLTANYGRTLFSFTSMTRNASTDSRAAQLKKMLVSPQLEFIMEAHSALSAKIVEEAGFKVSFRTEIT